MTAPKTWLTLLLGGAAFLGNYVVLDRLSATTELTAVRAELKPGDRITTADLESVPVRGGAPLFRGAVRFEDRDRLVNQTVRRRVAAGELLLAADVDYEVYQIDHGLLAGGERSLTLPLRDVALVTRPRPGARVEVTVRPAGGGPAVRYGPYTFLGWSAAPASARDATLAYAGFGVRADDPRLPDLEAIRNTAAPDRVAAVEVVRPISLP